MYRISVVYSIVYRLYTEGAKKHTHLKKEIVLLNTKGATNMNIFYEMLSMYYFLKLN